MTAFATIADITARGLLGRRRTILLVLLAGVPVIVAVLARMGGGRLDDALVAIMELGVRTVLPLTALVFGTSALGAELEDGTAVFVLAKPVPRWLIAAAKTFVAGLLAAGLTVGSTLLTGLLIGGLAASTLATTFAFGVAVALAGFAYAALFVALSIVTGRALIVGLIYTLVWEGILAGILEGTRLFSVREATLSVAEALAPVGAGIDGDVDTGTGLALLAIVVVVGLLLTTNRLSSYEVRAAE